MKKLIIDCDNTFGVPGCDLDDGLAIIYALASSKADLLGITTTFGNNIIDVIYPNTIAFMKNIKQYNTAVFKGNQNDPKNNHAANFLVEMANKNIGKLSIAATGSMTNLYHAYLLDNTFFEKLESVSIMGGITQDELIINGRKLDELNLSCNKDASLCVFENAHNIKIATAHNCLDAFFTKERFDLLKNSNNDFLKWLWQQAQYWFAREQTVFNHNGIYMWDVYAIAILLFPELFNSNESIIAPDIHSLAEGRLYGNGNKLKVNLPKIKKPNEYIEHVYTIFNNYKNN